MPKTSDGCDESSEISKSLVRRHSKEDFIEGAVSAAGEFRGFVRIPCVLVQRTDITPYLCGKRKQTNGLKPLYRKYGPHSNRLSQNCVVKVKKDDLEKLQASFRARRDSNDSGSETSASDMTLQCNICLKHYNSEKKLQNHQENKHIIYKNTKSQKRVSFSDHVIVHEVKEYHKCRKCPKIFEDFQSLKVHTRKNHRKRKCYICNYCDKKFVDRMFFKVHVRLHCDVCGELLPNRTKYIDHRKNVCKIFKIHKCKTCELSFFKVMDLKDHSYEHSEVHAVCDICKEQCNSKCGVAHHISYLHSKNRPTSLYETHKVGNERLYICNFCDESSVEKDIIEKHTDQLPDLTNRAMTGYKDYYFCDQCMKHFKTETEMLNHKWTHFLNKLEQPTVKAGPKSILKRDSPKLDKNDKHKIRLSTDEVKTEDIQHKVDENPKRIFNVNKKLPRLRKAIVKLERFKIPDTIKCINSPDGPLPNGLEIVGPLTNGQIDELEQPIDISEFLEVEYKNKSSRRKGSPHSSTKSNMTLMSNFRCEVCKYHFYNIMELVRRDIISVMGDFKQLVSK